MYVIRLIFFIIFVISFFKQKTINLKIYNDLNLKDFVHDQKVLIQNDLWSLSIPKIKLYNVEIKESVESDILENYIGHFPISSYLKGNICLAAHNNGFSNNYFSRINELEKNDKIYYCYNGVQKVYKVECIIKIHENDLSCLNIDEKDKLTLITCITNSPHERLCVQAVCEE